MEGVLGSGGRAGESFVLRVVGVVGSAARASMPRSSVASVEAWRMDIRGGVRILYLGRVEMRVARCSCGVVVLCARIAWIRRVSPWQVSVLHPSSCSCDTASSAERSMEMVPPALLPCQLGRGAVVVGVASFMAFSVCFVAWCVRTR
eukprot:669646-Rhodomonas_salina.1